MKSKRRRIVSKKMLQWIRDYISKTHFHKLYHCKSLVNLLGHLLLPKSSLSSRIACKRD